MSGAGYTTQGAVAVIRLDNPPVNGLAYAVRAEILAGLDRANADPAVSAVVLAGAGKSFSAGADINELGTPKSLQEPNLPTVIREIERNEKPVIAAMHGVAMGGGLELALGCHYRVAAPGTQISLPEVKLGLLPGAGGTQRLPRAVGLEAALNLIVSGSSMPAEKLAKTDLLDEVIEGDLLAGAVAFASRVARSGRSRSFASAASPTPIPRRSFSSRATASPRSRRAIRRRSSASRRWPRRSSRSRRELRSNGSSSSSW